MEEINTIEDVRLFVNRFYDKVRADDLIGPIFESRVQGNWPEHLSRMTLFWNSALFREPGYVGSPFAKHVSLPIDETHFDRWQQILQATISEFYTGKTANDILWRGEKMAEMFLIKLKHQKGGNYKSLL